MFQAGQTIICIDAQDSQGMLQYMQEYIVRHTQHDAFVQIEGMSREWHCTRFILKEGME